jgi:hypothetical protein
MYAEEGQPYGVLRGNDFVMHEGKIVVEGPNEERLGRPLVAENAVIGNITPDWIGSVQNTFKYKNFNLKVLIDVKIGGDMKSFTEHDAMSNGNTPRTLEGREEFYLNRHALGEDPNVGELTAGLTREVVYRELDEFGNSVLDENGNQVYTETTMYYDPQEWFGTYIHNAQSLTLYDASYVKLRQVTFSYSFPNKLVKKVSLKALRLGLFARNVWIIHQNTPKGIDPESYLAGRNGEGFEYGSQPISAMFGCNLFVKF